MNIGGYGWTRTTAPRIRPILKNLERFDKQVFTRYKPTTDISADWDHPRNNAPKIMWLDDDIVELARLHFLSPYIVWRIWIHKGFYEGVE